MNDKPSIIKTFDASKLSESNYFTSLLTDAQQQRLISDVQLASIQTQCMALLVKQMQRFTHGQSSSVRTETAQSLLDSIAYTMSAYLKSLPDADAALQELAARPAAELFQHGKRIIKRQIRLAKLLVSCIRRHPIKTDNRAYNDTLGSGIALFFSQYDSEFAAHETPGSIDYPLCAMSPERTGIAFILDYAQKLYAESTFCSRFSDIDDLLRGHHQDYAELLINIFERVLTNAVGCVLCGKPTVSLSIVPRDIAVLQHRLGNLPFDQLNKTLIEATSKVLQDLGIQDRAILDYALSALQSIVPGMQNALAANRLSQVFAVPEKTPPTQHFADGTRMDDAQFRRIADEIRTCRFVSDKIAMIKHSIHSIADLIDLLDAACIRPNEYAAVFASLDETTLPLLHCAVSESQDLHVSQSQAEWHAAFRMYLEDKNSTDMHGIALI